MPEAAIRHASTETDEDTETDEHAEEIVDADFEDDSDSDLDEDSDEADSEECFESASDCDPDLQYLSPRAVTQWLRCRGVDADLYSVRRWVALGSGPPIARFDVGGGQGRWKVRTDQLCQWFLWRLHDLPRRPERARTETAETEETGPVPSVSAGSTVQ